MSKFANAMNANVYTWNGALSYSSPDPSKEANGRLSLFFKGVRGLHINTLHKYLKESADENLLDTFLLVFHIRDCRGGKGERELGRQSLIWLFINYPDEFSRIIHLLPEYGRWDDLLEFFPKCLDLTKNEFYYKYLKKVPEPTYVEKLRNLQIKAVSLVVTQLQQDRKNMLLGKPCSLCAKWTPTEGDRLDRKTGIFKILAEAIGVTPRSLRKNYNTPLREYLKICEVYMCSGKWGNIDFNKVPSRAMKLLKNAFNKHDSSRYQEWIQALKLGKPNVKVNGKQLFPHELVHEMSTKGLSDIVIEEQWKSLINEVKKRGTMRDTIAVVDTSGSMTGLPLDVAIAMGMVISEVVEGPFHGHVITFSDKPKFEIIRDGSAFDRYKIIRDMEWGGSTNLEEVFNLILNRARECKLSEKDMPKTLIIISDMQFNQATNQYQTNWECINNLYNKHGYTRPQIVFWNVVGNTIDFPVTKGEHGTALISGFSPSILKALVFNEDYNPMSVLQSAIGDTRYDEVRNSYNCI